MLLFKTLYSHSASLHPAGVYMGTGKGGEGRLRGVEHLTNVLEVTRHFVRKSSGKPDETLGVPLRWTGTPSMGVW